MSAGANEWHVPYDRAAMADMFDNDLAPFVDRFRGVEWPMDISTGLVQRAIKQCATLNSFMETMESEDTDRSRLYAWLYPTVSTKFAWSTVSPLNLLNYVLLCMKSRYAAMTASAMMPSLYQTSKPHAWAGTVLQGWLHYVDTYGAITRTQFINIGHKPLPDGRPTIRDTVGWIYLNRDVQSPVSIFFRSMEFESLAPPREAPYATG